MPVAISRVQTGSREVNQLQNNIIEGIGKIQNSLTQILANPIVYGRLLQDITLAGGSNSIETGLGRNLIGWIITRKSGTETIYDTQGTNPTPNLTLELVASSGVVVDIYVF